MYIRFCLNIFDVTFVTILSGSNVDYFLCHDKKLFSDSKKLSEMSCVRARHVNDDMTTAYFSMLTYEVAICQ